MSDSIKESLSALMDDEVGEFELRRTLKRLDSAEAQLWSRYHLASAVLRRKTPLQPEQDVSAQVMAELEREPEFEKQARSGAGFQWRSLGSVAVAASVTLVVIFGAQTYQGSSSPVVAPPQIVLSGPRSFNSDLMSVQYGERAQVAPSLPQADVIRLSSSMEYYINQHRALTNSSPMQWLVEWMPEGFKVIQHDRLSDSEVLLYSNGKASISVSVQPFASKKASPGAVQSGDTVAIGKRVDDQFVTVVGDVPFMMADRIASSVALKDD
ncbi:MAG: sigma-E factor negative regulatory protein RseA [Motiliproteus sp.]|jgi:sigma-E factor negative regulatory protein RseA